MYFGACVLVMNNGGEILAVSRKDDKEDFGLPGGKVEPGETPIEAAARELSEETGYLLTKPQYRMIYHNEADGKLTVTYHIDISALTRGSAPTEGGAVAWVKPETLALGKTFGEYNRGLFKACGIRFESKKYSNDDIFKDLIK